MYFFGGADHSRRHPGDLHMPPCTTEQPPPHPGPANAAAWATTSCDVAGPSISTPTAGQPPYNHPPIAPQQQPDRSRATHNLTTGTTTQQNDYPSAGSGTTGPMANQPTIRRLAQHCHRTSTPTANRPHTNQPIPNRPDMQGSKRERRPQDWRHHGAPRPPTTTPTNTTTHHTSTVIQPTTRRQQPTMNPRPPRRAQA